jgi:hypothetical protein
MNLSLYFGILEKVHKDFEKRFLKSDVYTEIVFNSPTSGDARITVVTTAFGRTWDDIEFQCYWDEDKDDRPGVVIQKAVNKYFADKNLLQSH